MTPSQLRALCNDAAKSQSYPLIAPEHLLALLDSVEQRSVPDELDTIEQFYKRVCAQVELNVKETGYTFTAYRDAIQSVIKAVRMSASELSVEDLSTRLPDNTSDCQSLALDYQNVLGKLVALQAENALLKEYINGDVTWDKIEEIIVG